MIGVTLFLNIFLYLIAHGIIFNTTESGTTISDYRISHLALFDSSANYDYQQIDTLSQIEKYLPYINTENIFVQGKNLFLQDEGNVQFSLDWNIKNLSFSKKFAFFQMVQGGDFNDPREICFSKYKLVDNRMVLYDLHRIDKTQFRNTIYQFYPVDDDEFIACSFMLIYRIKITNSGESYLIKEKSLSNPYTVDGLKVVHPSELTYNKDILLIACDKAILLYRVGLDQIEDVTGYLIHNKYITEEQRGKLTVINADNDDFVIILQSGGGLRISANEKSFKVTPFDVERFKLLPGKDNFSLIFDYSSDGMIEIWREDGLIFKLDLIKQNKFTWRRFNLPFHPYKFLKLNPGTKILYASGHMYVRKSSIDNNTSTTVAKSTKTTDFDVGKVINLGYTYGVAVGDIDNDEKEEILFVEPFGTNRLLKFDAKAEDYVEIKDRFPKDLYGNAYSDIAGKFVDINNDSHPDLILSTMDNGGGLFLNNGNGYFRDVTKEYHLDSVFSRSESVALADFNNDGWIDIFVANFFVSNKLLINKNGAKFEDETERHGLISAGNSIHATVGDVNNDGLTDLLVVGWNSKSKLYLNRKTSFVDVTDEFGLNPDTTLLANSVLFADFNLDTYPDIFLNYRSNIPNLYLSKGGRGFYKATELLKENLPSTAYGAVAADFNNDSRTDIAINCTDNAYIYYNLFDSSRKSGFSFLKEPLNLSKSSINPLKGYGTGLGVVDANGDGDLDLIVGQFRGLTTLYGNMFVENQITILNQVKLRIHPSKTNSGLLGVKIWGIRKDSIFYYEEIGTGEGYCSQVSSEINIPVASDDTEVKIKVYFPASGDTVMVNILEGSYLDVFEHSDLLAKIKTVFYKGVRIILQPDFYIKIIFVLVFATLFFWFVHFDVNNYKFILADLDLSFKKSLLIVTVAFFFSETLIDLLKSKDLYNNQWRDQTTGSFGMVILSAGLSSGLVLGYLKLKDIWSWKGMNYKTDVTRLVQLLYMFNHGEGRKSNLSSIALLLTNLRFYYSETVLQNKFMVDQLIEKLNEFNLLTLPSIKEILLSLSTLRKTDAVQFDNKDFQKLNHIFIKLKQSAENLGRVIGQNEYKLTALEASKMTGQIHSLNEVMGKIKIKPIGLTRISLNQYLSKIQNSNEKTKSIGVVVEFQELKDDIHIYTNPVKLKECMDIVIKNSVESFCDLKNQPAKILIKADPSENGVIITIQDNGAGISESHLEKIFQRGFSTKGENRGMGLVYAKELLLELGGEIHVISKEFEGTEVKIRLKYDKKELS